MTKPTDNGLPFVERNENAPSDLTLDQYAAGELDAVGRNAVEQALAEAGEQPPAAPTFDASVDPEAMFAAILGAPAMQEAKPTPELDAALKSLSPASAEAAPPRKGWFARLRENWVGSFALAGVAAAAVAAVALTVGPDSGTLPGTDGPGLGPDYDTVRSKGSVALTVYRLLPNGKSETPLSGDDFFEGDRLRFAVSTARGGHLMVVAVDVDGETAVAYPPRGDRSAPVDKGVETRLPGAIELDGAVGDEWLHAVRCDAEFGLSDVKLGKTIGQLELPEGCQFGPFQMSKKARK